MEYVACDRCRRVLDPGEEVRYIIKIEVQVGLAAPYVAENDDDRDYLSEIDEQLEGLLDSQLEREEDLPLQRQYDLCGECYAKYQHNPLGFEPVASLGFSAN